MFHKPKMTYEEADLLRIRTLNALECLAFVYAIGVWVMIWVALP